MKITLYVIGLIVLIIILWWALPSHTYMNDKGCIEGKPAMSWYWKELCK